MSLGVVSETLILLAGWILSHAIMWGILIRKYKNPVLFTATALIIAIYLVKPATGDLWGYAFYFDTGYSHHWADKTLTTLRSDGYKLEDIPPGYRTGEAYLQRFQHSPAFAWAVKISADILPHGPLLPRFEALGNRWVSDSFLILIVLLGLLSIGVVVFLSGSELVRADSHLDKLREIVPLSLGSVFFFVGSQNSIRQFLMLACCLIFFSALRKRKYLWSLLFGFGTVTLHQFGLVFLVLITILMAPGLVSLERAANWKRFYIFSSVLLGLIIGLLLAFGLKMSVWFHIQEISQFIFLDDSKDAFRTSALIKLGAVAFILLLSEICAGSYDSRTEYDLRYLRVAVFFSLLPLVIFPEVFSRVLFLYFGIEMLYMFHAISRDNIRYVTSGLVVFSSYGLAPNALNVLVGKGWQEMVLGAL